MPSVTTLKDRLNNLTNLENVVVLNQDIAINQNIAILYWPDCKHNYN